MLGSIIVSNLHGRPISIKCLIQGDFLIIPEE